MNQGNADILTIADIAHAIEVVDKRKPQGRKKEMGHQCLNSKRSRDETAEIVGVSPRTVTNVRSVLDHVIEEEMILRSFTSGGFW